VKKRFRIFCAFCGLILYAGACFPVDWKYLDNGTVRIGVDRSRGACIGYFAESSTGRNLLNHYDEGRFIQQSYYGAPDGSVFMNMPWTYNPVQGGSGIGKPSRVLEFKAGKNSLYARVKPRNWPGGGFCPDTVMEETVTLSGSVARIHFTMIYTGEDQGPPRYQEMPAVFVDATFSNLVYTAENGLVRRVPGWPNENGIAPESWLAYLDGTDWGIGIYVPSTTNFTCYRFRAEFNEFGPDVPACSYVGPLRNFALTKGLTVEYDVFLTIGTLNEIRQTVERIKNESE